MGEAGEPYGREPCLGVRVSLPEHSCPETRDFTAPSSNSRKGTGGGQGSKAVKCPKTRRWREGGSSDYLHLSSLQPLSLQPQTVPGSLSPAGGESPVPPPAQLAAWLPPSLQGGDSSNGLYFLRCRCCFNETHQNSSPMEQPLPPTTSWSFLTASGSSRPPVRCPLSRGSRGCSTTCRLPAPGRAVLQAANSAPLVPGPRLLLTVRPRRPLQHLLPIRTPKPQQQLRPSLGLSPLPASGLLSTSQVRVGGTGRWGESGRDWQAR